MKQIIIIILFLNICNTFSQTGSFSQLMFNYKGNSVNLSTHPDFHREYFNLGWHWAEGKTNKSLVALGLDPMSNNLTKGYNPLLKAKRLPRQSATATPSGEGE